MTILSSPRPAVLACEGTLGIMSLSYDDGVQVHSAMGSGQDALERGLPLIDELLTRAGKTLRELDGLACTLGPGAFTSLRITLSMMKALAFSTGLPLFTLSTFDLVQALAVTAPPPSHARVIFLQPRKGVFSVRATLPDATPFFEQSGPTAEVVGALQAALMQLAPEAVTSMVWPTTAAADLRSAGWQHDIIAMRSETPAVILARIARIELPFVPRTRAALHAIRASYGEAPLTTGNGA